MPTVADLHHVHIYLASMTCMNHANITPPLLNISMAQLQVLRFGFGKGFVHLFQGQYTVIIVCETQFLFLYKLVGLLVTFRVT